MLALGILNDQHNQARTGLKYDAGYVHDPNPDPDPNVTLPDP